MRLVGISCRVCMRARVCTHVHVRECMRVCASMCVHVCMCAYACVCTRVPACVCVSASKKPKICAKINETKRGWVRESVSVSGRYRSHACIIPTPSISTPFLATLSISTPFSTDSIIFESYRIYPYHHYRVFSCPILSACVKNIYD